MSENTFSMSQFRNTADMIEEMQSALAAKDEELSKLREELASTYEELIDHTGDSMDDARANRVRELRA